MVERALGALRFVKNATFNITPFEAHHGREANTVLRNLTKKPTLRNLNWENVIRSKSACLDERDPIAQAMPEPMDTNWGIRSDTEYDLKNRRRPLKLADDQAVNQEDEPGIVRAPSDSVEITPAVVMQRTGERSINRYRPLNSDIVNQSKHTIEMGNGAVLRKSGVALKKAKNQKKRAPRQIAAPPTPWDLKRKLLTCGNQPSSAKGTRGTFHSTMGKKSRLQNLEIAEDSDSDAEDHLPLITSNQARPTSGGTNVGEEGQGTSSGGQDQIQPEIITTRPSNYETATDYTIAREQEIAENQRKEDTGGITPQETEREAEQIPEIPETKEKKRGRKQRLVSYSSQDSASSLDETSSRRSGRKRTAVTKMGAVMIDNIQKTDKPGAK